MTILTIFGISGLVFLALTSVVMQVVLGLIVAGFLYVFSPNFRLAIAVLVATGLLALMR